MTERKQPTSKFVEVNGLRIHYLEWGKAEMPVVVCVHGYNVVGAGVQCTGAPLPGP